MRLKLLLVVRREKEMARHKRDCFETYGLDFPLILIGVIIAAFIVCAMVMLAVEAIKDLLS